MKISKLMQAFHISSGEDIMGSPSSPPGVSNEYSCTPVMYHILIYIVCGYPP